MIWLLTFLSSTAARFTHDMRQYAPRGNQVTFEGRSSLSDSRNVVWVRASFRQGVQSAGGSLVAASLHRSVYLTDDVDHGIFDSAIALELARISLSALRSLSLSSKHPLRAHAARSLKLWTWSYTAQYAT